MVLPKGFPNNVQPSGIGLIVGEETSTVFWVPETDNVFGKASAVPSKLSSAYTYTKNPSPAVKLVFKLVTPFQFVVAVPAADLSHVNTLGFPVVASAPVAPWVQIGCNRVA